MKLGKPPITVPEGADAVCIGCIQLIGRPSIDRQLCPYCGANNFNVKPKRGRNPRASLQDHLEALLTAQGDRVDTKKPASGGKKGSFIRRRRIVFEEEESGK